MADVRQLEDEFKKLVLDISRDMSQEQMDELQFMYSYRAQAQSKIRTLQELIDKHMICNSRESIEQLIKNLGELELREVKEKVVQHWAKLSPRSQRMLSQPESEEGTDYGSPGRPPLGSRGSTPVQEYTPAAIVAPGIKFPLSPSGTSPIFAINAHKKEELKEQEQGMEDGDDEQPDDDEPITEQELDYIREAHAEAMKSTDDNTKVGAILEKDGRVIGRGHNFLPSDDLPTASVAANQEDTKHPYVTHAADNAVMNALKDHENLQGATLYTTHYPSCRDAVTLNQAGVVKLVYAKKKRDWAKRYVTGATKRLIRKIKKVPLILKEK